MQTRVKMFQTILFLCLVSFAICKVHFNEEFSEDWETRWEKTNWKADQQGQFAREKGKYFGDEEMAYGLQTTEDMKFYEISHKLEKPIKTGTEPFVFQYSLKMENNIECGGGYIKLVGKDYDTKKFGGETPLLIMFGPDICGNENKVHLILDFNGTGKLWNKKPIAPTDKVTHVYTFAIYPNATYAYYLDGILAENGTIADDWDVSVPKMIPDPNDKKPDDWDDNMYIDDPNSKKPDDWEDQEMIEDKDATKPEDWDDAKEGEWVRPKTKNPKYKGPWRAKRIYNPKYKGIWTPKKILNPAYTETPIQPYEIGGIGVDVWQVKHGSIYDNIMITDQIEEALDKAKLIVDKQQAVEKDLRKEIDKEEEAKMAEARKKMQEAMEKQQAEQPKQTGHEVEPEVEEKEDL